jgi:hypothetical protein
MQRAMARHEAEEAQVVPIILRPVLWGDLPFGKLQALPRNGTPVTSCKRRDEAFRDIAQGIQRIAFNINRKLEGSRPQETAQPNNASKESDKMRTYQGHQQPHSAASQKGYSLEEAVSLIEQTILHNNPATKDAVVTIEPRKIVQADGVRYEIDLYIIIDFGNNYKSAFIFECKNWERAVGKNSIIVFSEKINAVHAQKGFFVARSFSKDALERAKREGRMELLTASDMLDALPLFVDGFHYVQDNILHADIHFNILANDPNKVGRFDLAKDSKVQFREETHLLSEFNERVQRMVENEHMNHEPTGTYKEGSYHYDITKTLKFDPNELFVGGYECRELTARVQWDTQIIRPKIVSQFDIQSRGQVISFESEQISGGSIEAVFINIDQENSH